MTPTLGMYSMNMNGWQGLFQQGLGMLGGSSMGYGNYGSFGGSGIFTNCFGEPNYDAMAGYGVANALLGVAGQAIAANRKEKAPEVNYTQELSKISKEIEAKEIDKAEQADIINTKTDEIKTATDTKTKLTGDLKTAESNLNAYKKELNDATSLTEEQRNTIESKIAQAEKDVKAIEEKIAAQDDIINKATEAKRNAETKEAALQSEIDELKKKQAEYQKNLNTKTLDDADGNVLQRARKSCMDETYNEQNQASKADIRRAFNTFIKADNDDDKRTAAEKIKEMYGSNSKLADDFAKPYSIVEQWLKEHPSND